MGIALYSKNTRSVNLAVNPSIEKMARRVIEQFSVLFNGVFFIVTQVTVGLIRLLSEVAAFGKRFALVRNCLSFLLTIPIVLLWGILGV